MTIATKLVKFAVTTFNANNIPHNVYQTAILALIDQYGLQIGGSEFQWSKVIYRTHTKYSTSSGKSSITTYLDKVSMIDAAFINGSFAHAQDFDDSHQEAQTHPGSVVIPVAIAVGEHLGSPGEQVIKAIIIGMEIMLRLAHSLCPACIQGGHHTPPTVGPFGAAIAAGLLLELDEKQLVNALGICGSYAGGLVEYTLSGGSVKRIHTGLGAKAGVEAALLAKEGITGPETIIDGDKGLWAIFGRGNAHPERLLEKIGENYILSTLMFKPYNCCYLIHPAIEAFTQICSNNQLTQADIKSVHVGVSAFTLSHAGQIIIPKDELGAQFSISFTLALSLIISPPTMRSYTKQVINNQEVKALANRINIFMDDLADSQFPKKNGVIVLITTNTGENFELRVTDPKGSPENLMTKDDVYMKFQQNAASILGEQRTELLYQSLESFRNITNVNQLHKNTLPTG